MKTVQMPIDAVEEMAEYVKKSASQLNPALAKAARLDSQQSKAAPLAIKAAEVLYQQGILTDVSKKASVIELLKDPGEALTALINVANRQAGAVTIGSPVTPKSASVNGGGKAPELPESMKFILNELNIPH